MVVGKLELKSMFCLHFPFGSWHSIMKSPLLSQLDMDILVCIPLTCLIILVLNFFFYIEPGSPFRQVPVLLQEGTFVLLEAPRQDHKASYEHISIVTNTC